MEKLPALLTQQDIPTMLEQVKDQIAKLSGNNNNVMITDKVLDPFGKVENIEKVTDLIKAASSVLGREKAYKAAAKAVIPKGIKVPGFEIEGVKASDWLAHIKARVAIVANKEQLVKLNSIKNTLEENLSAEAKLANDLEKIKDMLAD